MWKVEILFDYRWTEIRRYATEEEARATVDGWIHDNGVTGFPFRITKV